MIDTLLGFKQKMGAVYINGRRYTATWIKVDPCIVTQIKDAEKDGYSAIQLGIGSKKNKKLTKSQTGHLSKLASIQNSTPRFLREVIFKDDPNLKVVDIVKIVDVFKKGDIVTLTGISKGKGFAGVVKRWRFAGGPKTHGQSDRERAPGSIGQRTTPGRVYKGKRMAGRMGQDKVTVKGLTLLDINEINSTIVVNGPVPGTTGGLIYIKKIGEGGVKVELVENVELTEKDKGKVLQDNPIETVEEAEGLKEEQTEEKEVKQEVTSEEVKSSGELNTETAK